MVYGRNFNMGPAVGNELNNLGALHGLTRKFSPDETLECSVWSSFDNAWIESDACLRARVLASTKGIK